MKEKNPIKTIMTQLPYKCCCNEMGIKKCAESNRYIFKENISQHTDSMAVGECQWAKIQLQKHKLAPSPQIPGKKHKKKININ